MLYNRASLLTRFFNVSSNHLNANKSLLGKLRKKTGYSFTNCKKALELNEHDIDKAEKWLQEQAKTLGWAKASKLAGRKTSQGLISIAIEGKHAAMVEFNCETDFVARNKQFQGMALAISAACLNYAKTQAQATEPCSKVFLDTTQLQALAGPDNKSLADHVALLISSVGENLLIRRAACVTANEEHQVAGFTHPAPGFDQTGPITGKFGSLLVYKDLKTADKQQDVQNIAKQLCQHVIGMNPKSIGSEEDSPSDDPEEENIMFHQEFLLDPSQYVGEVVTAAGIQPVEFLRYECGEVLGEESNEEQQPSETQAATAG
uniref:Elongation factor Ts, mitochondrial n=2 Tax=Cacopsylla melanoneura TaxID=428564 RepID=A0A8D8QPX7_9HEMI